MKTKNLKKLIVFSLLFLSLFLIAGCDNGGIDSDSFYINGSVTIPEGVNVGYEDIVIAIVDKKTESTVETVSLNKEGKYSFTTYKPVYLVPTIPNYSGSLTFTPEAVEVNSNKTVDFELVNDNPNSQTSNLIASVDSSYNNTENNISFNLDLIKNDQNMTLQELVDDKSFNLNLDDSYIKFRDTQGANYSFPLATLGDDINSHSIDLENNLLSLDLEEVTQELTLYSEFHVHFLSRSAEKTDKEVVINLAGYDELTETNFNKEITLDLTNAGLFAMVKNYYSHIQTYSMPDTYVGQNITTLTNDSFPIYNTTDISFNLNKDVASPSSNTSVIANNGDILSSGTTDLDIELLNNYDGSSSKHTISFEIISQ